MAKPLVGLSILLTIGTGILTQYLPFTIGGPLLGLAALIDIVALIREIRQAKKR